MTEKFTSSVMDAYAQIDDPRIKFLVQTLIKHMHAYIVETQLRETEWEFAWQFLAKMASFTHAERNEFLLMADVLGVSQLIEQINHSRSDQKVGSALLGPFYRAEAPLRQRGESIASKDTTGERVIIKGRVCDEKNMPIPSATLDIWQAATNGFYEGQDHDQPEMNLRGKFVTADDGTYELTAIMPTPYPVPTDGPTGELLKVAKRHPFRPAHIHFIVSAPGFSTLITQVFVSGDEKIQTDVVFTADENMIGQFTKQDGIYHLTYNFELVPGESTHPKAPMK